jgi:8-oxo-dGTP pyrophosphatase MutT (NUDIX family)
MEIKRPFAANGFLYNPKKQEVLLHLRDGNTRSNPNKWSFFGGRGEGEETPAQCCVREIAEELTISIKEEDLVHLRDYFSEHDEKDQSHHQYSFYTESDLPKSKMKLTEGADFDWVSLSKVFEYDLGDEVRKSLKVFVENINK